jgi:glycosyltransferase involved in cell wall biosynthesis
VNILQSIGWYFPESTGGSEVYLSQLVRCLRAAGVSSTVVAPLNGASGRQDCIDDTPVFRYPVFPSRSHAQISGKQAHGGFSQFTALLDPSRHDVYHQHSWTYGCGLHHLRAAKAAGLPTVLTIHVPGPVCLTGTMLNNGTTICDGRIDARRCAECWLRSRGAGSLASRTLALMPVMMADSLRHLGRTGTALAAPGIARNHLQTLVAAASTADRVIAVCQWLREALLINGIAPDKVQLSRQGLGQIPASSARPPYNGPLRVGFLGRADPLKGAHLLMEAVKALPVECAVDLQMHLVWSDNDQWRQYQDSLRVLATQDARIRLLDTLAPEQVPDFLAGIDILAVPSQWLETGPLVVLEAFAAGVPVLGSDLGGIAELVRHDCNGLLLPFDQVSVWTDALARLAGNPAEPARLAGGVETRVRSMQTVASEMRELYTALLQAR